MSSDDLENFEAERELQLAQEYQDVAAMFRYAVETERRFYLANDVKLNVSGDAAKPVIEVELSDAWVWDMYRKTRFVPKAHIALAYVGIGNRDLAFDWFEQAIVERSQALTFLKIDPLFDPVRGDPRFASLQKRVGF